VSSLGAASRVRVPDPDIEIGVDSPVYVLFHAMTFAHTTDEFSALQQFCRQCATNIRDGVGETGLKGGYAACHLGFGPSSRGLPPSDIPTPRG
jgi:hypothetical protein